MSGGHTTLTFLGGTETVTGSKFLLEHEGTRAMVDCGLFQRERRWRRQNWEPPSLEAAGLAHVMLTHCHLDHSGYLPALVRQGYDGPIWMSAGTQALTEIVLRDSAQLQERDAEDARKGEYSRHDPPLPLYTVADAEEAIRQFRTLRFDDDAELAGGVGVRLTRAGHVLGSASVTVRLGGAEVLFSGDLGRPSHPLLRARAVPPAAATVVMESTYGDRTHPAPEGEPHEALADVIRRTVGRGGSVLIPAFAVDRTELVLLVLSDLMRDRRIPEVPVFVDSPMALAALDVYRRPELRPELRDDVAPELVHLSHLEAARTSEESMRLNNPRMPCIIIRHPAWRPADEWCTTCGTFSPTVVTPWSSRDTRRQAPGGER
ncbi:MBL fold metallo-hydrolase [Georgenia sp. EYE_87]|uniref:MBL fold metallo-hydrolase n=1 Tax=Georgenia sp. EYE_87 TaxID=2853448 RepID=UPI0020039BCD|nr:MBL fold metallo-hydrolase [Georgenia sp. EYE_87]MCK6211834.1 MBL fold metallo-hydrolase [Georgenia sp. EYE_87]